MSETIKLTLDGEVVELIPTRGALESLSNKYTNLNNVIEQLLSHNFSVMADIIFYGVNKTADLNKIKDAIYEQGIVDLLEPLTDYIMLLMNGGKTPKKEVGKPENPEV